MRDAEARGLEIVGVYHSHTHTEAWPSPTDVRQAVDPSWLYVIVSLKDGDPVLRGFRIAGREHRRGRSRSRKLTELCQNYGSGPCASEV